MEPRAPLNRFERANELFCEALEVPVSDREGLIRDRCAGDDTLRDSILHLLSQYQGLGSFLQAPAFISENAPAPIAPGDLLAGRFRILSPSGSGGMGDVYRVEDCELGETVALKLIRARWRGEESVAARFRREIRLARKIAHPNVCRIFDLFVEGRGNQEILFFTMEFLDGPTLAQRLKTGPLDSGCAMTLARQIAAGLSAAHSIGIVHRDLKPANILLVPDSEGVDRAVITDFGLAKALDTKDPNLGETAPLQVMGTPAYMAPEQFIGGTITPATDVFAFGAILFEMLTGRCLFPNEDVVRAALRRITEPPAPLARHAPNAPAHWPAVIERAIATAPEKRFSSLEEMIRALEGTGSRLPELRRISRRALLYSGLVALPVAAYLGRSRFSNWVVPLPPKPLVMLTPITSSGSTLTARALDLLFANQLQQSAHVRTLAKDRMQAGWQLITGSGKPLPSTLEPVVARHVAMREGAHFVLFGNLTKVGDEDILQLQLEWLGSDPAHARKAWHKSLPVQRDTDLPLAVHDGANWMRRTVGETTPEIDTHGRTPEELTTASWQALREYLAADTAWSGGNEQAALLHLKTATDLDPQFALAQARTADILTALHRPDEGLPRYAAAAETIRVRNLTDRESLRIRGLFAWDTGRFDESERIFDRYALEYPDDGLPLFYKASAVDREGRDQEALHIAEMAIAREPESYSFLMLRVRLLLDAGRLDEADAQFRTAAKAKSGGWTDQMRSALALGRRDMNALWLSLQSMRNSESPRYQSRAFAFQACLRAEQGSNDEAERILRDGLAFDAKMGTGAHSQFAKHRLLAQLFLLHEHRKEALRACGEMLRSSSGFEDRMLTGCILAQTGDLTGARKCRIQNLPDWPIYRHWSMRLEGELALAQGNAVRGLQSMQAAPQSHLRNEWPWFLVRAAVAAGDRNTVRRNVTDLVRNPARYWVQADTTGPGFMSWAIGLSEYATLLEPDQASASSLWSSLHT